MIRFDYIEDYIEFIAGRRDIFGNVNIWRPIKSSRIRMANYDVKVIDDLSTQSGLHSVSYTDKQYTLAIHLCAKYAKQLQRLGVSPAEINIPCRNGIRTVDRQTALRVNGDHMELVFPFDRPLVEELHAIADVSHGAVYWNKQEKYWYIAATETNIMRFVTFCLKNNFDIDIEIVSVYDQISVALKENYAIELIKEEDNITIKNAPIELLSHIEEKYGGFSENNLFRLIDLASYFSYTISKDLLQYVEKHTDTNVINFINSRTLYVTSEEFITRYLDSLMKWRELMNEGPVVIYDPAMMLNDNYKAIAEKYKVASKKISTRITEDMEILYLTDPMTVINFKPWTLVNCYNMSFHIRKSAWIQNANRIIQVNNR